jgi:hypothetical protein
MVGVQNCFSHNFACDHQHFSASTQQNRNVFRRGSAYVAVLAISMIAGAISIGSIAVVRAQGRTHQANADTAEARLYAQSGIELGKLWISNDSSWRTNRTNGTWVSDQSIGNGTFTLEANDPVDGNLRNRPNDSIILKSTGRKGQAVQILQVTLTANPAPLPALQYAIHTAGELHVASNRVLNAGFSKVSTNSSFRNEKTIIGNIEAYSTTLAGNVAGTTTLLATSKAFPPSSVLDTYALLGAEISPVSPIDKQVLTPGSNPWGSTNAEGVYVIRPSNDFVIQNTRIHGTLVIVCPAGRKVTLSGQVLMQPYRSDYPSLIVYGNVEFNCTGSGATLSEVTQNTNYNPTGSAYLGSTNSTKTDIYPSEIQGLVHVYGTVNFLQNTTIRGLLLCESNSGADAVACNANPTIIYDANLYKFPPQGYASSVPMVAQPSSWSRVVN